MRAVWTIAVVLNVAVVASAQVTDPPTDITAPSPELAVESEVAVESEELEPTDSSPAVLDEDDLPPALRSEVAPPQTLSLPIYEAPLSPWKSYFGVSSGLALHLNARKEFQQSALAPAYLHLRGGVVVPGRGAFRHAVQLGVSANLSREGAYPDGLLALRQWVLVPSYVLRMGQGASPLPAWVVSARVGLPIVVSPDASVGGELALGAQYFARAGLAIFAEVIYDVFVGGRVRDGSRSTHHLLALEVGLQFELEVLP